MNRVYLWNVVILTVILLAAAIFDAVLQLGQFNGLVFMLYALYAVIAQAIGNAILWAIKRRVAYRNATFTLTCIIIAFFIISEIAGG